MPGETSPYGTVVNPGVLAPFHQHLFSIRIDPAIGGLGEGNTVMQEDSVPMEYDPTSPPKNNPYGVGYTVKKETIETSGWADAAPEKNRIFKVINPGHINPISGRPIGYKLVPVPSQLMISHPKSVGYARAELYALLSSVTRMIIADICCSANHHIVSITE
ncbi:copper amine oxidase [Naematelia encephala]|uniref:Amine oxidase n=1 Tax=Naematelia encephala TaxID=71784 RepID=A0A1Y2B8P6_9TREE|nr:copper amine oxidase [Naematelia encephala]